MAGGEYHWNLTEPDGLGPSEPFDWNCKSGMAALMVIGVEILTPAAEYVPGPTHSMEPEGVLALAPATDA